MSERDETRNNEEWRPIHGYEGLYEASSHGRIRRIAGGAGAVTGRILKQRLSGRRFDYLSVTLSANGKMRHHNVHRLVALAFLGHPDGNLEVNHKDGVKANNHITNLEYSTSSENNIHALATGLTSRKLSNSDVRAIRELLSTRGQSDIARSFGVRPQTIHKIARGKIYFWLS